jgi:hypothetical protein
MENANNIILIEGNKIEVSICLTYAPYPLNQSSNSLSIDERKPGISQLGCQWTIVSIKERQQCIFSQGFAKAISIKETSFRK